MLAEFYKAKGKFQSTLPRGERQYALFSFDYHCFTYEDLRTLMQDAIGGMYSSNNILTITECEHKALFVSHDVRCHKIITSFTLDAVSFPIVMTRLFSFLLR